MDEAVIKFYRRLLRDDFPNAGPIDQPSIFVEAVGEKLINCGNTGNYMQMYLQIEGGTITEITYRCACEPVANVAVEILCLLVKGKTLAEAAALTVEPFFQLLGSRDEALSKKAVGLLALMNAGLERYQGATSAAENSSGEQADGKLSWDGTLST